MTVQHPEMPDPVSAYEGDPNYSPWAHAIRVELAGQVLEHCRTASAKGGWAVVYVTSPGGSMVIRDGQLATEIRHGVVRLSWIEPGDHGMPRTPKPNDNPESPAA